MTRFAWPLPGGPVHRLSAGPYELRVVPALGGRIVSFRHERRDLLRPTPDEVLDAPRVYGFAGFPLIPYSGPLFGPGFSFAGITHSLARNVPEEPSATHGEAWVGSFTVTAKAPDRLDLVYEHETREGTFPFRFRGGLSYELSEQGLRIGLSVTNRDHRLMPAGLGFHPYFPKPPGTILTFNAVALWPPDAPEAVDLGCGPLEPGLDFTAGQDVSSIVADRLYEGWDGRAALTAPDGWRTVITADGVLDKLQLYSAWDYAYVCVEPVSNSNDGFNRMAAGVPCHGVRIVEPGRTIGGTIGIACEKGSRAQ
jgi:aldose 1-epimerase